LVAPAPIASHRRSAHFHRKEGVAGGMATLLEQTRATHEELEKYERVIALDLAQDTKSHRERLAQSHRVNNTLLQISDRASKLVRPSPVCGTVHDRQPDCYTVVAVVL
jgi:hypothetical protein